MARAPYLPTFRQRARMWAARMIARYDQGRRGSGGFYGSLTGGGIVNPTTGLGTGLDKVEAAFFTPTRIYWKAPLEIVYAQSAAAKKAMRIPVDDMFTNWRRFISEDEGVVDTMKEAERRYGVQTGLREAMVAGSVFGTGLLVMVTTEAPLDTPLVPERIREGDLKSLVHLDRFDASQVNWNDDISDPNFNYGDHYDLHPARGGPLRVHHSRVLRFDGIAPPSRSGWSVHSQEWGISELIPLIVSLIQDAALAGGTAHMTQEASIPVLQINGLRQLLTGEREPGEPSAEDIGQQVNMFKSIYRLMMLDKGLEDFDRVAVQFSGIAQLFDAFQQRIARDRDIPMTRWNGQSPGGLNSGGESEQADYSRMVESRRERLLPEPLMTLDEVVARSAGLREAPEYEFEPLLETSERDQAETAKIKAEALTLAVAGGAIDEDEFRASLDGDPIFGELPGAAPEPSDLVMPPLPAPPGGPEPGGGNGNGGGNGGGNGE